MINGKKVLAVIPARGGSKGIPGKNIKLLAGKPLISHSIDSAKDSKYIDRIIVSTDAADIANVAIKHGAEVPFMRPKELARDLTPDLPVFDHCLRWFKNNERYLPDIIVHLRPTGPLRTGKEIDEAIKLLLSSKADSVRSVQEPAKPPFKMWKPVGKFLKPFVSDLPGLKNSHSAPRQALPKVYETTADIGICWAKTILAKKSMLGEKVAPYFLKRPTVDIDTIFDFSIAEFLIKNYGAKK